MPSLPTTTSLRVVTAIAQHGTVSATAEAISLTQSAVSKQLRSIEELVGVPLFVRAKQGMIPTPTGMIYIEQARIALGAIETAALRARRLNQKRPQIRLHVLPILGDRWFMPRLKGYTTRMPEVDVQFVTFAPREVFREVDVVFRFGDGQWPGWNAEYFLGRNVLLVGSPQLLSSAGEVETIDDVFKHRLLFHPGTPIDWRDFFVSNGIEDDGEASKVSLGYYALVIRAAIAGQGLALVPKSLVIPELEHGDLINPAGLRFASRNCYWLTTPIGQEPRSELQMFCDWARDEAARTEMMP